MTLPIKGLQKTSLIDYSPYTSCVVFLSGCNFRCGFCQNPNLLVEVDKTPTISEEEFFSFLEGRKRWLDGVCMSVANTEPVLIKQKGVTKNIPIEDLWNKKKKIFYKNNFEFQKFEDIEAFTIGQKYLPITKVIRHKTNKIYEIITNYGYRILTTGNHSVFVLNKKGLEPKKVEKLSEKDYLVSPKKLENTTLIKEISVLNYFEKELLESKKYMLKRKRYWISIINDIKESNLTFVEAAKKYGKNRHTISNYFKSYKKGNLESSCYNSKPNLLWVNDHFLCIGQNKVLPAKMSLSREFIELLGYAAAEGSSSDKSYRFSLGNEEEFAYRILKLYNTVFKLKTGTIQKIRSKTGNVRYTVIVGGRYVARLFDKIIGEGAGNKKIPNFIFNTSLENKKIFFLAIHKGDGHTRVRKDNSVEEMSIKTISKKLASDLIILLRYFGVIALLNVEKAKGNNKEIYRIYFHGNQYSKLGLKKEIGAKYSFVTNIEGIPKELLGMEHLVQYKKQKRVDPNKIPKRYRGKIFKISQKWNILEVKKINDKKFNNYVYDLVVGNDHSFVGGVGGFLLHNTGGEPCLYEELPDFIRKIKELGYKVKLDTNGSKPLMLKRLIDSGLIDYIAMDIKGGLDGYYNAANVKVDKEKIKDSVKLIMESKVDYEFRMTVVPTLHKKEDFKKIGEWLKGAKRFFIQQFSNKVCLDKGFEKIKPFSNSELEEFRGVLEKYVNKVEIRA